MKKRKKRNPPITDAPVPALLTPDADAVAEVAAVLAEAPDAGPTPPRGVDGYLPARVGCDLNKALPEEVVAALLADT